MPVPAHRSKIMPARGQYAKLVEHKDAFREGELCFAQDLNILYIKDGDELVQVGSGIPPGTEDGDALSYDGSINAWTSGGNLSGGAF